MRGRLAGVSEIAGRGDQRFAEEISPRAVDDDARGERIVAVGDGGGEFGATTAVFERRWFVWRQHAQETPRRDWPFAIDIATAKHRQVLDAVAVLDDVQRRGRH